MWVACLLIAAGLAYTLVTNPRYQWHTIAHYLTARTVLKGLWLTIWLTLVVMGIATVLGLLIAVMRSSKVLPVRILAICYINLFRGTPVLVQLILWFNIAALYPNIRLAIPFTSIGSKLDTNALISDAATAYSSVLPAPASGVTELNRGAAMMPENTAIAELMTKHMMVMYPTRIPARLAASALPPTA